jgi:hypothetical protein
VRNKNKTAFCAQIVPDGFARVRVEMVCRLVDEQKLVFAQKQGGQKDLGLLAGA